MTKKEFNIDLDDPRAGKIAEIISNKTAKRILGLLADEELSESEISEKLGLPMNTVNYNVKKLREAGFIEPVKGFLWSVKGKRIYKYRISNKRVVISPKVNVTKLVASLVGAFILVGVFVLIAWQISLNNPGTNLGSDGETVKQFNSLDEMKSFIEGSSESLNVGFGWGGETQIARDFSVNAPTAAESSGVSDSATKGGSSDYSQTNIQVAGVDEPDIVKNDDKYIYAVSGSKVVIIDAYPAENMTILSEFAVNDSVSNIFVNGDKLIVFSSKYEYIDSGIACGDFYVPGLRCGGYSRSFVVTNVYDIADRKNPVLESEFEAEGYYVDARMINNYVYVISSKYIDMSYIDLPVYKMDGVESSVSLDDVYYFDSSDSSYVFNVISALNIDTGETNTEAFLTGGSSMIYVSENNIYLTDMKQISRDNQYELFVEEVLYNVFPSDVVSEIKKVMDSDISSSEKQTEVAKLAEGYMKSFASTSDLAVFLEKYETSYREFSKKLQEERERTVITRFNIQDLDISLEATGEIPGYILDQFSMDENDGYFRVATTTGNTWDSSSPSKNNLYVLNNDLEIVGELEGLASGERIYSTRFMGDRAYIVTFRQVDPLFAIDLTDPANPQMMGYLKVTGYSDYLHPYDETHLIGVGKEADENGRTKGIKISLFDVSNVEIPKEIANYEITDGDWSDSDALYDHKAFLFDKEKELLVIPVGYNEEIKDSTGYYGYRYEYWQGAYVFNINLDGIELDAKIAHDENSSENSYWYGGDYVRRSLFMDEVLYTVSNKFVKANSLNDFSEIKTVELPYSYDYRGYGGGIMID